jgi:hypothetical protein
MKLKNIILLTGMLLPVSTVFAQYAEDALRFSQTEQGATARFRGMGSAQIALGGDISALNSNPAGIGLFTRSEFSFTPQHSNNSLNAQYFGSSSTSNSGKAGISQLGAAFYKPMRKYKSDDEKTGWLSTNFAISYNRTNNFNTTLEYTGSNNVNSFTDYAADQANEYLIKGDPANTNNKNALPAGTLGRMAYDNFLIDYNPGGYFSTTAVNPGSNVQKNQVFNGGSQSEFNFGIATNYSNKLYLGGSVSIASINFSSDREFTENGKARTYVGQEPAFINASYSLDFNSYQETKGSGYNAKFGAIYRASPNFRLGASFISPTWYILSDEYTEGLDTRYTPANGSYIAPYTNDKQTYPNDYNLRTPYRANLGAAAILNKIGLISADVEFVDYTSMKFTSENEMDDINMRKTIRDRFNSALNLRLGLEAKVTPSVQLRAGYDMQGNPYKERDYSANAYSAGLGYRVKSLSFDLAFTSLLIESTHGPYTISEDYPDYSFSGSGPTATLKNSINSVFATIGFRF